MTNGKDNFAAKSNSVSGWVHFAIAAGILLGTAIGWPYALALLKFVTQKEAVAWPAHVMVNPDTFRWESFPEIFDGRFELVPDGEFGSEPDGIPDGEILITEDVMESLGIGTSYDRTRVDARKSNWFITRLYRDNTKPYGHPMRYWRIDIYYYTGGLDTVPHIPERCFQAAGAVSLGSETIKLHTPKAKGLWGEPVEWMRARFELPTRDGMSVRQVSEYYVFSLNGKPEPQWTNVRAGLTDPRVRYCYFSKIQFGPHGVNVTDVAKFDKAAEEFISYLMPAITAAFPTPEDVKAAGAAAQKDD